MMRRRGAMSPLPPQPWSELILADSFLLSLSYGEVLSASRHSSAWQVLISSTKAR
jgi:hypothetical protein